MHKHIIIVMEGGGAKGPFEVGILESIEKRMGKYIADIADAFVTTSMGTINGSILATKKMSAYDLAVLMLDKIPYIFKKRIFRIPRYDRKKYVKIYKRYIGEEIKMGDIDKNIHFIATSTNMCDGHNHFFKSDNEKEKDMLVTEATQRSFAAPLYFGQINDKENKSIWLDGGCGIENMPLWQAYVEAWKRGWFKQGHSTHILAIGCGHSKYWIDYEKGSIGNLFRQTIRAIRYYNSIKNGSLARNQSTAVQVRTMSALANAQDNLTFQYVGWPGVMKKKLDKMDNIGARYEYYETGKKVGNTMDLISLKK